MSDGSVVVAPPPPLPYKDRSGWLVAFGIFEILIGCVFLLMIAITVFGIRGAARSAPMPRTPFVSMTTILVMITAFYGALAVLFVVIGIGSIQARRWARIAMLIVSGCWLAQGVLGTAMMAFMLPAIMQNARQQSQTPMPAGFDTAFRIGMLAFLGLFFVVLPLIFVLFYSGKNVKATCEARRRNAAVVSSTPELPPARPLKPAVVIAAIWFAVGTFSYLVMLLFYPVLPLLGFMLRGWSARAALAIMAAVSAWLALNLYRERVLAWRVAVIWLALSWASALVTQWRMDYAQIYRSIGLSEIEVAQFAPFATYGMLFGFLFGAAFFVFLIVIRKQFNEPAAQSA